MRNNRPKTIYAIYCRPTKRIYIGCCAEYGQRVQQHFRELRQGLKTTTVWDAKEKAKKRVDAVWQQDFNQHGEGAFDIYLLEMNVAAELAESREIEYILKYRANEPKHGYNIRPKAQGFLVVVKEGVPPLPAA